jgi:hypothetical protein
MREIRQNNRNEIKEREDMLEDTKRRSEKIGGKDE